MFFFNKIVSFNIHGRKGENERRRQGEGYLTKIIKIKLHI
jgi:hypothetical protein